VVETKFAHLTRLVSGADRRQRCPSCQEASRYRQWNASPCAPCSPSPAAAAKLTAPRRWLPERRRSSVTTGAEPRVIHRILPRARTYPSGASARPNPRPIRPSGRASAHPLVNGQVNIRQDLQLLTVRLLIAIDPLPAIRRRASQADADLRRTGHRRAARHRELRPGRPQAIEQLRGRPSPSPRSRRASKPVLDRTQITLSARPLPSVARRVRTALCVRPLGGASISHSDCDVVSRIIVQEISNRGETDISGPRAQRVNAQDHRHWCSSPWTASPRCRMAIVEPVTF
jgi:hypothetical protein